MSLKDKIELYFSNHYQEIKVSKLIKLFNISNDDIYLLEDILFNLECNGKIIYNEETDAYMHVAEDYYLEHGIVDKSTKEHYFIHKKHGKTIHIKRDSIFYPKVKKGDYVYVSCLKSSLYRKCYEGEIVRIIKKPHIADNENKQFLNKGIIKRDSNNKLYIEINNKRYLILTKDLNGAYVNDEVTVECFEKNKVSLAKVKDILNRKSNEHIFMYKNVGSTYRWQPLYTSYFDINFSYNPNDYSEGDLVLLSLDMHNNATLVKRIYDDNTIISKIKLMCYEYNIPFDFPFNVIEEANNISGEISEDEYANRVDLRNLTTITIDPPTSKDMDDAISLEVGPDGYRLYVSIADVSNYVKMDSKIFEEALKRTTSIYPSNYCIPMLPIKLSNDICSLKEGVDRLAKTCIIDLDYSGNVISYNIVNSIIKSNKQMSYDKVNELFNGVVDKEYAPYFETLIYMNNLSHLLSNKRKLRGNITFESKENEFIIVDEKKVVGIEESEHGEAQELIENFMLLANECTADFALNLEIPYIYRNHDKPDIKNLLDLSYRMRELRKYSNILQKAENPKILQNVFSKMCENKTDSEKKIISKAFLQSLKRAIYETVNRGHYALALDKYATFTSPIRRFPDLLNHIMIDDVINGKFENVENYFNKYVEYATRCSEIQKDVEDFEKRVDAMLIQMYLCELYDKVIVGHIEFIRDSYAYITTKENLHGYLYLNKNSISKDSFVMGSNIYKVGNTINVQVESYDKINQEIVFRALPKNKVRKLTKE